MADVSVRPARVGDAAAIAEAQLRTWRNGYGRILPPAAVRQLTANVAESRWRDAVQSPPSPRHRLLVAIDGGYLVGFSAFGPADDDDLDPQRTAEIYALLVDPAAHRRGHGSRLLNATADTLRDDGFTRAVTWLFDTDVATEAFFEAAGWGLDGASRDLDMGSLVHQVRLHTDLS